MILDTSALAAILFGEPEAERYVRIIHRAERCLISVANWVELTLVVESQLGPDAGRQCDAFLRRAGIVIEPVSVEQGQLARQAFLDFGKGRHPAGLNFGDCFAYALAKVTGDALLFKGDDFARTDLVAAMDGSSAEG
jgi:ribonuclease VapC